MKENRKDYSITVTCALCGKDETVKVNHEDYEAWKQDTYAQDAFPYLTPEERDVLITHMCISCQEKIFGKFKD